MKKLMYAAVLAAAAAISFSGTSTEAASAVKAERVSVSGTYTSAAIEPTASAIVDMFTEDKTTQYFTDDAVAAEDITTILKAGINAESGMNVQNWHFSALTKGSDVLDEIVEDMNANRPAGALSSGVQKAQMGDAPLNIVISCPEGSEFDAGLAAQNMACTAQALGYGIKIVSSPVIVLNGDRIDYYKELLGIPSDMQAEAVLLVGTKADTSDWDVDTYTGASVRSAYSDMVTIVE